MRSLRPLAWIALIVGAWMTLAYVTRWLRFALWQLQATLGPLLLIAGLIGVIALSRRRRN